MSSRSGSSSHRRHSREPLEDFPPLPPVPRLPSLRALAAQRDRDSFSPNPTLHPVTRQRHMLAAARRAERIRRFENSGAPGFDDLDRSLEDPWASRLDRIRSIDNRPTNFEDLDRSLEEANSHLRALLDLHNSSSLTTPLMPPNVSPPARPTDLSDDNRRHKRRKLDSDKLVSSFQGFRYGKYGQVEPGPLKMEIVSCDGGIFATESPYVADNILKNDKSVYCTKGNRCNIVLRHQGATVFTLQELVIKAPASHAYSHPVREGMVFIVMKQDEILSRTAQYQIQYTPNQEGSSTDPALMTLENYGNVPQEIVSIRHHNNGTTTSRTRRAYAYRTNPRDDNAESRTPLMPPEFTSNQPDFNVTTECSDDEDDEDAGPRFPFHPPNRIGSLPFENQDSDDDDDNPFSAEDFLDDHHPTHWRLYNSNNNNNNNNTSRRPPPQSRSSLSLAEAWEAHATATQEAVRAVGGELLVPHARFFIEKKKSKCTIRFDPPVSGRFILLKMWSSHHDPNSNIDIQSVIAGGFAGPRYFPSVQLR